MQNLQLLGTLGQAMQLLRPLQLQPMLNPPQELIRLRQLVKILAGNVPFIVQLLERKQRASRPEPSSFSAIHALQALSQKLDIADPAAVQLHINRFRLLVNRHQPSPMSAHLFS